MEEIKIEIEGINAKFANSYQLNAVRQADPQRFSYRHGILMFDNYRVILPILGTVL